MSYSIRLERVDESRLDRTDFSALAFGQVFTDHMFLADFRDGAWHDARIVPYGPFTLDPSNLALHYGQSIFEGMKATRSAGGEVMLWRPGMHAARLNRSAARLMMPALPEDLFLDAVDALVALEAGWVPPGEGSALYIRPFMFATESGVGVRPADRYRFAVFCCPVGPYYAKPVKLLAETEYVRAAVGGVGEAKAAGNYAASLLPAKLAQDAGCDQVLWLDAKEHRYVQEVGTMNLFFVIDGQVVTPATDGAILHGITRDSILRLLADDGRPAEVRPVDIAEVVSAHGAGTLTEAFGAGTAAVVSDVASITYQGSEMVLPDPADRPVSAWVRDRINGIRSGRLPDPYGWLVEAGRRAALEPELAAH